MLRFSLSVELGKLDMHTRAEAFEEPVEVFGEQLVEKFENISSSSLVEESSLVDAELGHLRLPFRGGVGFIELGAFRLGYTGLNRFKHSHFSISSGNNTCVIFRSDGTVHKNKGWHLGFAKLGKNNRSDVLMGDGFLQFAGGWRLGFINDAHISIAHRNKTAMIWRWDGTQHPGPRNDYNAWKYSEKTVFSLFNDGNVISMGNWRIGDSGLNSKGQHHLSVYNSYTRKTIVIYTDDGVIHPGKGKRTDWAPSIGLKGGFGFIELGAFRLGYTGQNRFGHSHFSISSGNNTCVIFRSDGTVHKNKGWHLGLKKLGKDNKSDVVIGNGFLQFAGGWRLGVADDYHFSIAHHNKTAMIWRADGTQHRGPSTWFNAWQQLWGVSSFVQGTKRVMSFNDGEAIEIGLWRIGNSGKNRHGQDHLSIFQRLTKKVSVIYRSDGTIHPGPRNDWIVR